VKLPVYSSLAAFLAHWRALRNLTAPVNEQAALLAEMESILGELGRDERDTLERGEGAGDAARRRQRAERHLSRIMRQRGVLSG
jgi:hypothetical protein